MKPMKRQSKTLTELGIVYLAVSILLDFFLASYQILLWPSLALAFAVFSILVFNTLWMQAFPGAVRVRQPAARMEDEFARLEHLCDVAINQGEAPSGGVVSERVRALAVAAAAHHLNITEDAIRSMAERDPGLLDEKIGDELLFHAMTGKGTLFGKGRSQAIREYLVRIQEWTN